MYGYGDMDPQIHPGHIFEHLGSRDVIDHVTIRLPMGVSYRWSMVTMRLYDTIRYGRWFALENWRASCQFNL